MTTSGPHWARSFQQSVFAMSSALLVIASVFLMPSEVSAQAEGNAATRPFCALPLSTVQSNTALKKIHEELVNEGFSKIGSVKEWPTKTIPIFIHSSFNSTQLPTLKAAISDVEEFTGIQFMNCTSEVVLGDKSITGYLALASIKAAGCGFTPCVRGAGYRTKTLAFKSLTGEILQRSRPMGMGGSSKVVYIHELMHALGLGHAHQNPKAKSYLQIRNKIGGDCSENLGIFHNIYDPGSITHYEPKPRPEGTCGIELNGCRIGQASGSISPIFDCKIEDYLRTARVCAYSKNNPTPVFGEKCFRHPTSITKFGVYRGSDFSDRGQLHINHRSGSCNWVICRRRAGQIRA